LKSQGVYNGNIIFNYENDIISRRRIKIESNIWNNPQFLDENGMPFYYRLIGFNLRWGEESSGGHYTYSNVYKDGRSTIFNDSSVTKVFLTKETTFKNASNATILIFKKEYTDHVKKESQKLINSNLADFRNKIFIIDKYLYRLHVYKEIINTLIITPPIVDSIGDANLDMSRIKTTYLNTECWNNFFENLFDGEKYIHEMNVNMVDFTYHDNRSNNTHILNSFDKNSIPAQHKDKYDLIIIPSYKEYFRKREDETIESNHIIIFLLNNILNCICMLKYNGIIAVSDMYYDHDTSNKFEKKLKGLGHLHYIEFNNNPNFLFDNNTVISIRYIDTTPHNNFNYMET
jgi:hypothetical protein